jgi:hypothetical protein
MSVCIPQIGTRATCLVDLKYRSACLGSVRAWLGRPQVLIALVFKKKNLGDPFTINPTHLALIRHAFFFAFFFADLKVLLFLSILILVQRLCRCVSACVCVERVCVVRVSACVCAEKHKYAYMCKRSPPPPPERDNPPFPPERDNPPPDTHTVHMYDVPR